MKLFWQRGLNFGFSSGIITTLGLMVGMYASTQSKAVVLSSIITIAIADAFSDSFAIHLSEEAQTNSTQKSVWQSTLLAFVGKFIFALIFVVPILLFTLSIAVIVNLLWGAILMISYNLLLAKRKKIAAAKILFEHLSLAIFVVAATYLVGLLLK